jgi:hypothetical protein
LAMPPSAACACGLPHSDIVWICCGLIPCGAGQGQG